jgi:hypothetical protein
VDADAAKWETSAETEVVIDLWRAVSDPDGDPITIKFFGISAKGKTTLRRDGTLLYKPKPGAWGPDSFLFEVTDGQYSVTGTVRITISGSPSRQPSAGNSLFSPNTLEYARIPSDRSQGITGFWLGTTEVPFRAFKKASSAESVGEFAIREVAERMV